MTRFAERPACLADAKVPLTQAIFDTLTQPEGELLTMFDTDTRDEFLTLADDGCPHCEPSEES